MPTEASFPSLAKQISQREVPSGQVFAWWLGGSGFVFKTSKNVQVWIDPYLSDMANVAFGLERAFPTPVQPEEAAPDVVVATHWHEDHLDAIAIPIIAKQRLATRFIMPPSAMARAISWGVPRERITPLTWGQCEELGDAKFSAVPARHEAGVVGWEVPDAMGVVIEVEGIKIYHSGDTEYDSRLRMLKKLELDVFIGCINGVTGNMNAYEAALLAWQLKVQTAIPMHHLLWANGKANDEATLDPNLFSETYAKLGGQGRVILPSVGAEMVFSCR
jgi:L-ascorbate 6-phosphate lactonase